MSEEQDDDTTPPVEYFITGLVVLFFGLLYYLLNHGAAFWSPNESDVAVSSPDSAVASSPLDLQKFTSDSPEMDSKMPVARAVEESEPTANQALMSGQDKEPEVAAAQDSGDAELIKAQVAKLQAEEARLNAEAEKLQAEKEQLALASEKLRAEQEALEAAKTEKPESEEDNQQTEATKNDEDEVATKPESQRYLLPGGKEVVIAEQGFEDQLRNSLAQGSQEQPLVFDAISFKSGSAEISPESKGQIEATAALLNTFEGSRVLVRGHTDNVGEVNANSLLSLSRSNNLKKALVNLGIDRQRIKIEGVGPLEPIASNDSEEGRRTNRRLEVVIIQ